MIDEKRAGRYHRIHAQLTDLIEDQSPNLLAGMATICAVLHPKMPHHLWTGFYSVADEQLHVGPYQGAVACQTLKGGVCLRCAETGRPIVVPDVEQFPGHIACDPRAKSEIVLPLMADERVVAVLEIDADKVAQFDEDDVPPLTSILALLQPYV